MLAALLRACAEASVPPAALGSCIRRRATLVREAGPSLDAELAILVAWAGGVERATHMHGSSQINERANANCTAEALYALAWGARRARARPWSTCSSELRGRRDAKKSDHVFRTRIYRKNS